jgi:hypothetical protein
LSSETKENPSCKRLLSLTPHVGDNVCKEFVELVGDRCWPNARLRHTHTHAYAHTHKGCP